MKKEVQGNALVLLAIGHHGPHKSLHRHEEDGRTATWSCEAVTFTL